MDQVGFTALYRESVHAWDYHPAIRECAHMLGISKRQYCDTFVHLNTSHAWVTWSDSTSAPVVLLDADRAYLEACGG